MNTCDVSVKVVALRKLFDVLSPFIISMDSDAVALWESVEQGGDIHNIVYSVQSFYGGKLPSPEARNPWRNLLHVCRHVTGRKRKWDARLHAIDLQDWACDELIKYNAI